MNELIYSLIGRVTVWLLIGGGIFISILMAGYSIRGDIKKFRTLHFFAKYNGENVKINALKEKDGWRVNIIRLSTLGKRTIMLNPYYSKKQLKEELKDLGIEFFS